MSSGSELQSVVSNIVDNNYVTLVILTAIGYDYILTFSDEVEYIWNQPWSRVSTLFFCVRYFGLCGVTGEFFPTWPRKAVGAFNTIRVPSDEGRFKGDILIIFGEWAVFIFISAAGLAMMLRVWAIYNRSRIILGILLTLYVLEVVPLTIACVIASTRFIVATNTVQMYDTLQVTLSAVLCLLAVIKFFRDSFQMYKVTEQWQPSRYLNLFAREGLLYFLAMLLFALVNVLNLWANIPITGWRILFTGTLEYVPVFTLTPRFIMSVRALYARDLRDPCRQYDIDTEFGSGDSAGGSASLFAGRAQKPRVDWSQQSDEIQMREI